MDTDKLQMEILRKKFSKVYYEVKDDDIYVSPDGHCVYMIPQYRWYLNFETLKNLLDCREADIEKLYGNYLDNYYKMPEFIATEDIRMQKGIYGKKIIKLVASGGEEMFIDYGYYQMFAKGSQSVSFYAINKNSLIVLCQEHGINRIAGLITRVKV